MTTESLVGKAKAAFLGAGYGDALGWPQERRSAGMGQKQAPSVSLRGWSRRTGGRFYPHAEVIQAGEYSDDTQLLAATARSLAHGNNWWDRFARIELPMWLAYERGGGGATKRAAELWSKGRKPWTAIEKESASYFEAGGNGVAMRILPHCFIGVAETDFSNISASILANGVTTHGHPRALIGAIVYGFALWQAFTLSRTLKYGELISTVLDQKAAWQHLPDIARYWPDWNEAAGRTSGAEYEQKWAETVNEQIRLLEKCKSAIDRGALAVDAETLKALGCLDKNTGAAGTVTAAAALFLASRYAAEPLNGVLTAAFADGTDTDTIASMTGAILGALAGAEWLGTAVPKLQDRAYLEALPLTLQNLRPKENGDTPKAISKKDLVKKLERLKSGDKMKLPDGRSATVLSVPSPEAGNKSTNVFQWKLEAEDGQSLFVKKIERNKAQGDEQPSSDLFSNQRSGARPQIRKIGAEVLVKDLKAQLSFYKDVLGLEVLKSTARYAQIAEGVSLVLVDASSPASEVLRQFGDKNRSVLYLEVTSIERLHEIVSHARVKVVTPISNGDRTRFFRCLDPEGNLIEVVERKPGDSAR